MLNSALSVFIVLALAASRQAVDAKRDPGPCDVEPFKSHAPYCNTKLDMSSRLDALVKSIPTEAISSLMGNGADALNSSTVYLPSYQWWSEALHGVAYSPGVKYTAVANATTSFPQVCLTAATWDRNLFSKIGDVVGREARAMHNLGQAGLTFWAPNINIYRDPRWGRGQETPGEDPYLTSVYAMHYVRGFQNNSMDPHHLRASSCCKHFAFYDLEDWGGYNRISFDAVVSLKDMVHTYMPAFEACMHEKGGAASGVMCSYNAVNGTPMCANPLINSVAREQFGFNGYVTSDCGATGYVMTGHHYTDTTVQTMQDVLTAGEDIACGGFFQNYLNASLMNRSIDRAAVDVALKHQFSVLMRLGYFDPIESQPYSKLNASDIDTPEARALALEVAESGIVLLENVNRTLPLNPAAMRKVAVVGPNAARKEVLLGNYYGRPPYIVSVLEGIQYFGQLHNFSVAYAEGCLVDVWLATGFDNACAAARDADAVVIVVGNDQTIEAEDNDRESIGFPGVQNLFVNHMMRCTAGKIIVVTLSGGSMDYSEWNTNPRLGALLWAGYPGQSGGTAIANIIFGVVSPSGRLPHTAYPAEYVSQLTMTDMQMEADPTTGYPGRTYKYYTGTPVYPFGWMYTFTEFDVTVLNYNTHVSTADITRGLKDLTLPLTIPTNAIVLNVTNVGEYASRLSLVLKITAVDPGPDIGGTISDFVKIFLKPQQWQIVTLYSHLHASLESDSLDPRDRRVRIGRYRWSLVGRDVKDISGLFSIGA